MRVAMTSYMLMLKLLPGRLCVSIDWKILRYVVLVLLPLLQLITTLLLMMPQLLLTC
jgi:hypothetical protein